MISLGDKIRAKADFNAKTIKRVIEKERKNKLLKYNSWLKDIAQRKAPHYLKSVLNELEHNNKITTVDAVTFKFSGDTSNIEEFDIKALEGYSALRNFCKQNNIHFYISMSKHGTIEIVPSQPFYNIEVAKKSLKALNVTYTQQKDGFLVVNGNIDLSGKNLTQLPDLRPVIIEGVFSCYGNKLTSLEGSPVIVREGFFCENNQLTTLEGAPSFVGGHFSCSYNKLISLRGAPEKVRGDFYCSYNQLKTFEGAPKMVGGRFAADKNPLKNKSDLKI